MKSLDSIREQLIRFAIAILVLSCLPSVSFAQVSASHNIPNPVSFSGGNYSLYVNTPPNPPSGYYYWEASVSQTFVTLNGTWIVAGGYGSPSIAANVGVNYSGWRYDQIEMDLWFLDLIDWWWYYDDTEWVNVNRDTRNPSWFECVNCVGGTIYVLPNGATIIYAVHIGNIDVELKYTYNGNPTEYIAGPYHTDSSGTWTMEYYPEHYSCCAGEYHFIKVRNANGGEWQDISVYITLAGEPSPKTSASHAGAALLLPNKIEEGFLRRVGSSAAWYR